MGGRVVGDVVGGQAGADPNRQRGRFGGVGDLARVGAAARLQARYHQTVGQEEVGRLGRIDQAEIGRDGVGRMFLLDVSEDLHPLCPDLLSVAQQGARASFDQAFVGDVPKDEAFGPDEISARAEGRGQRLLVGAG